jgi:hypothetical protein
MKKEIVNEVIEAYKNDKSLSKKTLDNLLGDFLRSAGLKSGQIKALIGDLHLESSKAIKKNKLVEPEHGTSCPRLVFKKDKKLIGEW